MDVATFVFAAVGLICVVGTFLFLVVKSAREARTTQIDEAVADATAEAEVKRELTDHGRRLDVLERVVGIDPGHPHRRRSDDGAGAAG